MDDLIRRIGARFEGPLSPARYVSNSDGNWREDISDERITPAGPSLDAA